MKELKIGYITDTHGTSKIPNSRTDNYPITVMNKFLETGKILKDAGVDILIHGGDLSHTAKTSLSFAGSVGQILKSYNIPIYVVPGNHDFYGYNYLATIDQTILGLYAKTGVVKLLTKGNPLSFDIDGLSLSIEGQEYYDKIDTGNQDDYNMSFATSDYNILAVHGMLVEKPFPPNKDGIVPSCTLIKDITSSNADMILAGHYHPGWKPYIDNNIQIYNPGSLLRVESSKVERKPRVMIITISRVGSELHSLVEYVDLKCAKPNKDIFDFKAKAVSTSSKQLAEEMKNTLSNNSSVKSITNINDIMDSIVKLKGIDQNILLKAHEIIAKSKLNNQDDDLSIKGFIEKPYGMCIQKVVIKNFQSHEHTTLDFVYGTNVITGMSNSGKTAILRAILWCLYDKPKGTAFIRTGTKNCSVEITFSDDSKIMRTKSTTSSGEYVITHPDGTSETFKGFGNSIPINVVNVHQMPKVMLTQDLEVNLNVSSQLEGPFLIKESNTTKCAAIGRLTGTQDVDTSIKTVTKEISTIKKEIKVYDKELEKLNKKIGAYDDLKKLKSNLDFIKSVIDDYENKNKNLIMLNSFKDRLENNNINITNSKVKLNSYVNIDKITDKINNINKLQHQCEVLKKVIDYDIAISNCAYSLKTIYSFLPKQKDYDTVYNNLTSKINDLNTVIKYRNERIKIFRVIQDLKKQIEDKQTIPVIDTHIYIINKKIENINELGDLLYSYNHSSDEVKTVNDKLNEAKHSVSVLDDEYKNTKQQFKNYLISIGRCPTCGNILNDEHIEDIINDKE